MMTTRTIEGILFGLLLTLLITGAAAEGVENVTTNGTTTAVPVVSPTAEVLWQALYGVDSNTSFLSLLPGREDGCILAGIARPSKDLVLAWTNRTGALLDQRRVPFGPGGGGNLAAVSSTADGGLLAVGSTRAAAPGDEDVALLRLGADGSIIWSRTYAIGAGVDRGTAVLPAADGGYLVAGTTASPTGGTTDLLLVRVDDAGGKVWHRIHSLGAGYLAVGELGPAPDGGYLLVGSTDVGRPGASQVLLVKITADGTKAWQRTYAAGVGSARGMSLVSASDGGSVLLAGTGSSGADPFAGLLVGVDTDGRERWRSGLGGNASRPRLGHGLATVDTRGYLIAGHVGETETSRSFLTLVDQNGREAWNHTWSIRGTADSAGALIVSSSDRYLVAGDTVSSPGGASALYLVALAAPTVAPNLTPNRTHAAPYATGAVPGNVTSTPTAPPSTPPETPVATTTTAPPGVVSLFLGLVSAALLIASRRR